MLVGGKKGRLPERDSVKPEPLSKEAVIVLHALISERSSFGLQHILVKLYVCEGERNKERRERKRK